MHKVKSLANYLRFGASSKFLLVGAAIVISGILLINNAASNPAVVSASLPRDKDNNAIIWGGALTANEFAQKYQENKTHDLPQVYERFGLSSNELDRFKKTAVMGTVYKNGDIKVNGKKVAYNAKSLGRQDMTGSEKLRIADKDFFLRPTSVSFGASSIAALVMYTPDQKQIESVIITSCGNPVTALQPTYQCDMLNKKQISKDTFQFDSKVTYRDGATLTKVVYDFGDGQKVEKTNPSDKVTHKYAPGNYTAKVTAYFSVFGETKTSTSTECSKPVSVPKPNVTPPQVAYACDALKMRQITRTKFEFTAKTSSTNGATLKDADFDFGDDQTDKNVKPKTSNTVVVEHEYSKAGNYNIVATVNFNTASGVKSDTCQVDVTVAEKPVVPVTPASVVEETPTTPVAPAAAEETPTTLPSTGPAEIAGGAIGLSSIVTAGGYYLRSRRDLLNTAFKK